MRKNHTFARAALLVAAIAVGTLGTMATPLQAQRNRPGGGPGFFGGNIAGRLAQKLNLTDDQKSRIQGFLEEQRTQRQALRNDAALSREQKQEKMREIQQQTRDNIRSVLSVEQQMKIEDLRKQAQDRRQERANRVLDRLAERLALTDSQKETIRSYRQAEAEQLQALRDNSSLTPEQKREQFQTIRQHTQEQVRSVLTPDQQQKLDDMRQQARESFQNRRFRPGRRGQGGVQPQSLQL